LTPPPILDVLPHRAPFLFVDEIVEVAGDSAHCRFRMPDHEDSFAARMFGELVLVEALAQTTAVHVGVSSPDAGPAVGLLGGVERLTFEDRPRPGDTVDLFCTRVRRLGLIAMYRVEARRDGERLCRATLTVRSGGVP
jgi:3-hydroxymyristoyl/3-hydroxydecanoyl-(acyl carrier protein) dehydratase